MKSNWARISRGAAGDSVAAPRLTHCENFNHGLQPWLRPVAAPRLDSQNSSTSGVL